jgi:polyisoprenyl-phosphate glycosyltransferase
MQVAASLEESPKLSIVSTIYNDGRTVPLLVEELTKVVISLNISYEIILVNDNSIDDSEEQIKKVCEADSRIKGLSLARNYGQQIAVSAGMKQASGEFVLIIDGDLENPVSAIPELYKKIQEGYDVVFTVSKVRQTFYKRITSQLFWFVLCKLLKINIIKNQLLLRIMSRKMVNYYNSYGELSRSVAGINQDIGLKTTKLEVTPNKRVSGRSNYNFSKRLNIFIDIALNMSLRPLNFVIFIGFFTFVFSALISFYYLYVYMTQGSVPGYTVPGYTSTILSILFFGSILTFTLGIMSRYLSLIYLEVRNRPLFLIKEKYNL